jgi:hypothetical protein
MNNLALFVTHHIFLTKDQMNLSLEQNTIETIGYCVPVWVDAHTGMTTEPASEVFCHYKIYNSKERNRDIEFLPKKGYEIFLPNKNDWLPPPLLDFEKMAVWSSEEREVILKERDRWWFKNPKPPDVEDLKNGYLRFEVKKTNQKILKKIYSAQHVIEISEWSRLEKSLTI